MLKICSRCKNKKLTHEFYKDKRNYDGLNRKCKYCSDTLTALCRDRKEKGKNKKEQWKQRIRKEFDEPAKDVIQSFARNGYSKRLTAGAIEITTQTLLAYCRRENITFADRIDVREECKPKPQTKGIIRNPWGCKGKK